MQDTIAVRTGAFAGHLTDPACATYPPRRAAVDADLGLLPLGGAELLLGQDGLPAVYFEFYDKFRRRYRYRGRGHEVRSLCATVVLDHRECTPFSSMPLAGRRFDFPAGNVPLLDPHVDPVAEASHTPPSPV